MSTTVSSALTHRLQQFERAATQLTSGAISEPTINSLERQARQALGRGDIPSDAYEQVRATLLTAVAKAKQAQVVIAPAAQARLNALDAALAARTLKGARDRDVAADGMSTARPAPMFVPAPSLPDTSPAAVAKNGLRQTAIAFFDAAFSTRTAARLANQPTRAELQRLWAAQRPNNAPVVTNLRGIDFAVAGGNLVIKGDGTRPSPTKSSLKRKSSRHFIPFWNTSWTPMATVWFQHRASLNICRRTSPATS